MGIEAIASTPKHVRGGGANRVEGAVPTSGSRRALRDSASGIWASGLAEAALVRPGPSWRTCGVYMKLHHYAFRRLVFEDATRCLRASQDSVTSE